MMNEFLPEGRSFFTPENERLLSSIEGLEEAFREQIILEAIPYRCDPERNLHWRIAGTTVIMPRSECGVGIAEGTTREISILSRVGKPTAFLVTGFEGDRTPQISRKEAQVLALQRLMSLPLGSVIPATVTHLEQFGAFVDIGCGVTSLIPIDAISVSRIPHPGCRFQAGDEIFVVLREKLPEQNRFLLSHRELLGTWAENAAGFLPGEVVTGVVRGVLDYGIFVELTPNLPALAEYVPGIENGDLVSVFIKSILPEKEKIKLLILERLEGISGKRPPEYYITDGIVQGWSYHRE
jgi:small subunit ribosomal protein S1